MPGLVPGAHVCAAARSRGWPGIRAFTPVFDGLCPAMTEMMPYELVPLWRRMHDAVRSGMKRRSGYVARGEASAVERLGKSSRGQGLAQARDKRCRHWEGLSRKAAAPAARRCLRALIPGKAAMKMDAGGGALARSMVLPLQAGSARHLQDSVIRRSVRRAPSACRNSSADVERRRRIAERPDEARLSPCETIQVIVDNGVAGTGVSLARAMSGQRWRALRISAVAIDRNDRTLGRGQRPYTMVAGCPSISSESLAPT